MIGSVDARGESSSVLYYSFRDGTPSPGENLYRLKMIDTDNKFAYSRIQSLNFDSGTAVYPNPLLIGDKLTLDTNDPATVSHVRIYDVLGKVVYYENKPGSQINVNTLQAGVYIVQITSVNGLVSTHRIVKQ